MNNLLVNQLIELQSPGGTERILWVDPLGRGFYSIDVTSDAALPVFRTSEDIDGMLEMGGAKLVEQDTWLAPCADQDVPERYCRMRDESWDLIRPLVFDQPAIFETRARGRAVRRLIEEGKTTKQTLYRLLRRYWQRGMTPNALLPDYSNCGAPGRDRKVTEERRRAAASTDVWSPVIDADIRANQAEEKMENRRSEAFRFQKQTPPNQSSDGTVQPFSGRKQTDYSDPDMTEILRSLAEEDEEGSDDE